VLRLGQFLEIRHLDVVCTHCAVNQNTEFTVDRSLSTHIALNCDSKGLFTTVK